MLLSEHFGPALAESMWPLRALAAADADRISALGETSLSCPLAPSGSLEVDVTDQGLWLVVRDGAGEVLQKAIVQAWGDDGSEAYWWLFGWLEEVPNAEHLREAITRAKMALGRLSFYDLDPIHAPDGVEATVIDYMRLASGVTDEWIISMAAPHELILDDMSIGGGHGLLHCFRELLPGLAANGECALIGQTSGDICEWWMRPVMCVFGNELGGLTISDLRGRLVALGFTAEDIERLDRTAEEVRQAYAYETAGELREAYSG